MRNMCTSLSMSIMWLQNMCKWSNVIQIVVNFINDDLFESELFYSQRSSLFSFISAWSWPIHNSNAASVTRHIFLTCVKNSICIVKMSTKCFMWWQVTYLNMSVIIYVENHIFFIHVRNNFDKFTIKMQPQLWGIYFYLCVKKLSQ